MKPIRPTQLLLLLVAAACGPSGETAPDAVEAPAPADTVRADGQIQRVRQGLEQAERDAAARARDAQDAAAPR